MLKRICAYLFKPYRNEYEFSMRGDDGGEIKCYRKISRWDDFAALVRMELWAMLKFVGIAIAVAIAAVCILLIWLRG